MKLVTPVVVTDWVDGDTWTVTHVETSDDGWTFWGYNADHWNALVFPAGKQLERLEQIAGRLFPSSGQLTLQ